MANNESYHMDPAAHLEEILESCLWERLPGRWWEKGRSRLLVDEIGIFLYRLHRHQWVSVYGLAHNRVQRHLPDLRILFYDGFSLDLATGD